MKIVWTLLFVLVGSTVHAAPQSDLFGKPHPQAPPELRQLEFLIGEWRLTTWFRQQDGSRKRGTAFLTARYVLGGFGVELLSRYPGEDGQPDFLGTTTYVYNPRLKKWVGTGINTLGNRKNHSVDFSENTVIVTQSGMLFNGRPGVNRLTYLAIKESSFEHVFQNSPDNGKTWLEPEFGFKAQRVD